MPLHSGGQIRRTLLFPLLLAVALVLFSVFLGETLLRIFWKNPGHYGWNDFPGYVRLLRPNQDERYTITGLYEGAGEIRFRTGSFGQILNSGAAGSSWAIGGSTTECRYVPENRRWPDQVRTHQLTNFGSSGCSLGDLYFNAEFLFLSQATAPQAVYLMEAVNDLSSWRDYLKTRGDLQAWARARSHFHTTPRDARSLWGRRVWLVAWYASIRDRYPLRNFAAWSTRDFYIRLRAKSAAGRAQAPLAAGDFERFRRGSFQQFLGYREKILTEFGKLVGSKAAELILVTQPNAFRDDYHPYQDIDLRDTPELEGGFASYEQTGELLRLINAQTRQWSARHGLRLVDLEKAFETESPSNLFYDSVHYTEKGSEKVAWLINHSLPSR